jgi:putative transposase
MFTLTHLATSIAVGFEQVGFATLEWVDWFNNKRLLEPIGNIPPAEAEARYYAQIEERQMAA